MPPAAALSSRTISKASSRLTFNLGIRWECTTETLNDKYGETYPRSGVELASGSTAAADRADHFPGAGVSQWVVPANFW